MNILESKLAVPDFTPYLVRDRLFSFLENNLERSLICLASDGGYGKTTLVSSFIKIKGIPTVWYQVGQADRFPHVFLTYLKTALTRIQTGGSEVAFVAPELVDEEFQQLIRQLAAWPTRLFIVLDDYQWVDEGEEIQELVSTLIFQAAKTVTFLITSRVRPHLPLVKLKLQHNLAELRARDLAFTKEEANEFFNTLHQLTLKEHELDFILSRTEGWIASLQLIHDLIKEMSEAERYRFWTNFTGIPDVYEYLGSEVLASQSEEIQSFLWKTSLLAELHVDIVNQYLGVSNAQQVLDHLLTHHLFIYRTEEGSYKYHQLFRMFLYEKLLKQTDQQQINGYHQQLARIYEEKFQFFNAFAHYISGKDSRCAVLAMRQMSERYHPDRFFVLIDGWLETISPDLSLEGTSQFLFRCLPVSILDEMVEPLEKRIAVLKQKQNPLTIAYFLHRLATIQFYRGDLVQSRQCYQESLDACYPTNHYGMIAMNLSMLGQVHYFMKDHPQAIHYLKSSLSYSEPHGVYFSQLHSLWMLSEIYLEKNNPDKAEPLIHQAIAISKRCDDASKVFPYCSMVKLHRLRKEYPQALEWAMDAVKHAETFHIDTDLGWAYLAAGLTYLAAEQLPEAEHYLAKAEDKLTRELSVYLKNEVKKLQQQRLPAVAVREQEPHPEMLSIRVLGTFEIKHGDTSIRLPRKSSLRLLQFFITHREKMLIKDSILDQVFPEGPIQAINNQFYVALSGLRKTLEPALQSGRQSRYLIQTGEHFTFCTQELELDVDRFLQALVSEGEVPPAERIKQLRLAEQSYRGDYFEEYPYDSYLEAERERLRIVYLNVLRELAGCYWDRSDFSNGMHYYEKLLEKEPYQEGFYMEYLERLLHTNHVAAARKVAERSQRWIERELGVPIRDKLEAIFAKFSR